MRGQTDRQQSMFVAFDLEQRIPEDHPLRPVKAWCDRALAGMSRDFNAAYARTGRASIPPETLIKALLLRALFSIPSERRLCEAIEYTRAGSAHSRSGGRLRRALLSMLILATLVGGVYGLSFLGPAPFYSSRELRYQPREPPAIAGVTVAAWARGTTFRRGSRSRVWPMFEKLEHSGPFSLAVRLIDPDRTASYVTIHSATLRKADGTTMTLEFRARTGSTGGPWRFYENAGQWIVHTSQPKRLDLTSAFVLELDLTVVKEMETHRQSVSLDMQPRVRKNRGLKLH